MTFLRNYAATRGFRLGTPKLVTPTPDGKSVLFLRSKARDPKQSLWETDVASGGTRELLAPEAVMKGPETLSPEEKARRERLRITASGFTSFELSEDGAQVLLTLSGRLFVLARTTGALTELQTGAGAAVDPHFSHDGKRVGYVRDNDVRAVAVDAKVDAKGDAKGKEVSITKGGTEAIPHGLAEFAAQEEFGRLRGFWWSPDGAKMLYEEADQTKVEQLTIQDPAHPEKAPDRPYYPRAGKTNADVKLALVRSDGKGKPTYVTWDRAKLPYVVHVVWSETPAIYVMDRLQQHAELLAIDEKTGKTTVLVEEHDEAWINVDSSCPVFLPDGRFLWSSEREGDWRLEVRDKDGKNPKPLTGANVGYREVLHVDGKAGVAYLALSTDPEERHVAALPLAGGAPVPLAKDGGAVMLPKFGRGGDLFAGYEASRDGVRRWIARSVDGKRVRELPSLAEEPPKSNVAWTTAGPGDMRVALVRPKSYVAGKKYPLVDSAYGGPHVAVVTADGSAYAREQWLADALDAIVVKIDAQGTPFRGRIWERAIRLKFDRVPVDGHVSAIQALAAKVPEIDLSRVGVFGWSFGGYFAALAILARGDLYKVGVAGAPVVDWRDYDTAYTERYLGLPDTNKEAYDRADVTTWAKRPVSDAAPSRPLLLFHGTADDNVYFVNSLKLTDALSKAGRTYEFVPLSGQTHQLASAEANEIVWGRSVAFLRTHL